LHEFYAKITSEIKILLVDLSNQSFIGHLNFIDSSRIYAGNNHRKNYFLFLKDKVLNVSIHLQELTVLY